VATAPCVEGVRVPPFWPVGAFRLRPLRPSDAPAWHAYLSDPRVVEHTSLPEFDLAGIEAAVARQLDGYATATSCRWAVADPGDTLVGTCGFSNWSVPHSHAELVYDLHPGFWGRGLMRAAVGQVLSWAFEGAGFNRVHAYVMTTNAPSIRLLEVLGFAREGTLQQFRIARGVPRDFFVYALLRSTPRTGPDASE
jgi:ribosomal-protein-alanine N-acetyltransferase